MNERKDYPYVTQCIPTLALSDVQVLLVNDFTAMGDGLLAFLIPLPTAHSPPPPC